MTHLQSIYIHFPGGQHIFRGQYRHVHISHFLNKISCGKIDYLHFKIHFSFLSTTKNKEIFFLFQNSSPLSVQLTPCYTRQVNSLWFLSGRGSYNTISEVFHLKLILTEYICLTFLPTEYHIFYLKDILSPSFCHFLRISDFTTHGDTHSGYSWYT